MASYLRSWLPPSLLSASTAPVPPPVDADVIVSISEPSPPSSDSEDTVGGNGADNDEYDDAPPLFPSLSSIQRSDRPVQPTSSDAARMPPPPFIRLPGPGTTSDASILAPPPTTTTRMPNVNKKGKARAKVALAPGHSPLDWGRLKASGVSLRSVRTYF